ADLYAGGSFTGKLGGGSTFNHIAKWDGATWTSLGTGVDNTVYAMAVSGSQIYAGGIFTNAGGVSANRLAVWDGSTWSPIGSGTDAVVRELKIDRSNLYAGGNFTTAGGKASRSFGVY